MFNSKNILILGMFFLQQSISASHDGMHFEVDMPSETVIPFEIHVSAIANHPNFLRPTTQETVKYFLSSHVVQDIDHFKYVNNVFGLIKIKLSAFFEDEAGRQGPNCSLDEIIAINSYFKMRTVSLIRGDTTITHYAQAEVLSNAFDSCELSGSLVGPVTLQ